MKKTLVITGGSGKFAQSFKKYSNKFKILFPTKEELNILSVKSISNFLKKKKPDYLIHNAALSRPMILHEKDIIQSIRKNIIGTCNIVIECSKINLKIIYFSTNYVYEGVDGNYLETSPLKPVNNYAWSKLGGECAVQMYKNSLILRLSITEEPFIHSRAFSNIKSSFIYHSEAAKFVIKLIDKFGIINIGGKTRSVYSFGKIHNPGIIKSKCVNKKIPLKQTMNLNKLKKILG